MKMYVLIMSREEVSRDFILVSRGQDASARRVPLSPARNAPKSSSFGGRLRGLLRRKKGDETESENRRLTSTNGVRLSL